MGGCLPPSVFFFGPSVAPLTEVLLGLPLSVNLLGLFPPPGVLRVAPKSRGGFPWVVTFLFPEGRLVVPDASPKGKGGLEAPLPGCTGTFPTRLPLSGLPGLDPDSGERFSWVVTFLFTEERVVVPDASSEGEGDLETPALDCPGAFPARLLVTVLSGLNSDSSLPVDGLGELGVGPNV